ncbi:tetratricopeptide repeat protein [Geoalkalibacter sp.]|uniref:tetratricopeptide repeat protein n=1 Tax=Geoalkalibacter sp. TaxID=3041440 RepID=UPI00272E4148|nr:hypothetical protein [Geoalkalibacter sp.]
MSRILMCATLLLALVMGGCEQRREQPTDKRAEALPRKPFHEALEPELYELPSGALATWRAHARHQPALVLFANHPYLDPLPETGREELRDFLRTATPEDIVRRARFFVPDPAFLPPQALSAAIAAGLFSEIVFVYPGTQEKDAFSLEDFQRRALAAGFLNEEETRALSLHDGVIGGRVRGLPLRCVHPEALPSLDKPVILHIDLGYFKDLYQNEIRTPVYDLLHQTATAIRDAGFPALAVTLSFSNAEVGFSLESRFMISDLAELLRRPAALEGGTPRSWTYRAAALFAGAMFMEGRFRELTEEAAQAGPADAAAQYALSLVRFQQGRDEEGFALLDRAVALDRGFALDYLELAEVGAEQGRWDKVLELIEKAAALDPRNPFPRLRQADALIQGGRGNEALPLLDALRRLPWSPRHHPDILRLLEEMMQAAGA